MTPITVIALLTLLCLILTVLVWRKSSQFGPVAFLLFVYYFSLYGAWDIIVSKTLGAYADWWYLESKLVGIEIENSYIISLLYYSLFFASAAIPFLVVRKSDVKIQSPVAVNLVRLSVIGWGALLGSYYVVKGSLGAAMELGVSGYSFTRFDTSLSLIFSLHQILNRISLLCFSFSFVVWFSNSSSAIMRPIRRRWLYFAVFTTGLISAIGLNYVLGNKNPLLIALVCSAFLFDANTLAKRRLALVLVCVASFGIIGMVNMVRGMEIRDLPDFLMSSSLQSLSNSYVSVAESNEKIAAHISMYAVLQNDIPPAYGASILPLLFSVVPRFLWPNRPEGIYTYYTDSLAASSGQGYTIHHATGWYLNFGLIGIILGGWLLGYILAKILYSQPQFINSDSIAAKSFGSISPYMAIAVTPEILRAGIEGYKSFLVEGLVIPALLIWLVSVPIKSHR